MAKSEGIKKVKVSVEKRLEVRKAAFVRVVTPRVNKALKSIRLVGACAGANYSYTPAQAEAVYGALSEAMQSVVDAFAKKVQVTNEFVLKV